MNSGFRFKGRHSKEFGIIMKTSSRPIQPQMKSRTYDAPLSDGSYDFSAANSFNRAFYQNRIFTMLMQLHAPGLRELNRRISKISSWLSGRGILEFDDTPNVQWSAVVINGIDYAPERYGHSAALAVSFETEPFAKGIFNTFDGPVLDIILTLDSAIPIGMAERLTYEGGSGTVTVPNCGTWYVRPEIVFDAGESAVTYAEIKCGNKKISYSAANGETPSKVIFDCKNHTAADENGNSLNGGISGEFFELAPGENTVEYSCSPPAVMTVGYTPEYIHDFETDWGADDA